MRVRVDSRTGRAYNEGDKVAQSWTGTVQQWRGVFEVERFGLVCCSFFFNRKQVKIAK